MPVKAPSSEKRSGLGDTIFAFVHLALLAAVVVYDVVSLIQGNWPRSAVITGCLIVYYFLVLHKPVVNEIRRKRGLKPQFPQKKR